MSLSRGEAYAILELPVGADPDSIRSSYKRLIHKWLPDTRRVADNHEIYVKFQDVSRAYQRLITDNDVSGMTQKEMFEVYQQVFAKPKPSQSSALSKPLSNGCQQKYGINCVNDNSDSDTDMNDSSNEATGASWNMTKGATKENGCILSEEQEHKRIEKRKAKKKQRKERKKMDKEVSKSVKECDQQQQAGRIACVLTENPPGAEKRSNAPNMMSSSSDDADEFAGAFYSCVRNKHSLVADTLPQESRSFESRQPVRMEPADEVCDPIVVQSRQLAMAGNEQANCGDYARAIDFFTEAIKLDPTECRFYGNRSYCYDRQHVYDKALLDAEKAISLSAAWPKGYFRKGRALAGLKRYMEAEEAFKQVLAMDPKCDDAVIELHRLHVLHMTEMGFSQQQAELALASHSSFQQALDSLLSGFSDCTINQNGSVLRNLTLNATASNRNMPANGSSVRRQRSPQRLHPLLAAQFTEHHVGSSSSVQISHVTQSPIDVKMDPSNPEGLTALWVGNVLPQVSEKKLVQMFSRYGTITSIRSLPDKFCAFINFKEKESASQALVGLQGADCAGQKLLIKFPDHPLTSSSPNRTFAKTLASSVSNTTTARTTDLPQRFRKK